MQLFQKQVRNQIKETRDLLDRIQQFQKTVPKGSLIITHKQKKVYYKWQYLDKNLKCIRKYLSKREMKQIQLLAQKGYYEKVEPILQKNLKLLEKFERAYCYDKEMQVYESMTEDRQSLIIPLEENCTHRIRAWEQETYEPCNKYPETLRYETNAGDFVRSKSEVIIANLLHMKADQLLYKYERPLKLRYQGRKIIVYPDFTILNTQTGKFTYWEHAGLMSKPEYVSDFVWKNSLYYENHLLPGTDVLFTFETEDHPLEIRTLKHMISDLMT